MKTVLFSPVFNQAQEFPRVLDELKSVDLPCDEVLLINNGSSDGSEEMVRKAGYPYLDIPENRGVGYSIIVAIDWAIYQQILFVGAALSATVWVCSLEAWSCQEAPVKSEDERGHY